jgi:ribosomal protein S18 acetylase RimI-like enzyme
LIIAPCYIRAVAKLTLIPKTSEAQAGNAFVQAIELREREALLGCAVWSVPSDLTQGVAQIVDLTVPEDRRRRGYGSQLILAVIEQARPFFKARDAKLRRIWLSVEQKSQVVARSFLMKHNFHHTASISDLLKGQDALIYTRAFD